MQLIISEKSIAGERIAEILADGKISVKREDGAQFFQFAKDRQEFEVIPLRGHITDLEFPKKFANWYGTDLKELTAAEILYTPSEPQIAELLRKKAALADKVIIATDADREGESIGLEAIRYLKEGNPKILEERAYFSAITPKEIKDSFSKLQKMNYNLADSADARREIDLIWGAVLTRFLSLMSGRTGKEFLSVGRVQTPTLAIVVDKEKERQAFKATPYWELKAILEKDRKEFEAMHKNARFLDEQEAKDAFEKASKAEHGIVEKVTKSKRSLAKPVPFNTTEFLRSASSIGVSPGEAMNLAESLYMQGFISYPRTDNQTYNATLDLNEILNGLLQTEFSALSQKILSKGKLDPSKGKETKDHPPIHPEMPAQKSKLNDKQWKVYELVVRRFLATLSEPCETENLSVEISLNKEPFLAKGQLITKMGWKEFYPYSTVKEVILPELNEGDKCKKVKLGNERKETQPPARYSQASLIKLMEDLGLGTKSTRAEIIQKLYARQYIFGAKAIEASNISFAVIDSLEKNCPTVTKPEMTSDLEKQMDDIAEGKKTKEKVVQDSRKILLEVLEEILQKKNEIASELRQGLMKDSILGKCPKCEGMLRIMFGRTGKRFVGCTSYPKCTNSYPLPQNGRVTWLGKECPQEDCKAPMISVIGKRGKYEMCLNMNCKTKALWKKPAAKTAAATSKPVKPAAVKKTASKAKISKPVKTKIAVKKTVSSTPKASAKAK
ncbi:MAG: DNA topoisomerase I [Candidatus Diapherotrites archaeon]|nr:DNA topoisomerase I [Candidatus Diapherotrites archaeon]